MRKNFYYFSLACCLMVWSITGCKQSETNSKAEVSVAEGSEDVDHDEYDEAQARMDFEIERTKDPKLGYVPLERMLKAVDYTENLKSIAPTGRVQALNWVERGPSYDTVGNSNGNIRGASRSAAGVYTAGRTRALLIDTLNDPTGNTVFCGSVAGGLWKCTNFLSAIPNWQVVNDRFDNLAISYICQDPSNPQTMYFSTGEPYFNSDRVSGLGVWKSTNGGATWSRLMATASFNRIFKIICDASGNVYLAARTIAKGFSEPVAQTFGVMRSKDQGATWVDITPTVFTSSDASCTDLEISSTGKLHISLGYFQSRIQHQYTNDPANVTASTGWNISTGIRTTTAAAYRMELATMADTIYAVTVNTSSNLDSAYKSIDGGATFTKQNTAALPSGVLNGQGWYNLTLSINPINSNEIIVGGLDAYKSSNGGASFTRLTYWVGTSVPYVHADHHFIQWWMAGSQSRIVIGGDGGIYISNDAGATFTDKNRNLNIKQFYDGAIHPTRGSNYMLAGAQDNGTHQLNYPGLGPSIEVTGGDGAYVHINQQNPMIQFGAYVYNDYRRSTNGGQTWSSVAFGSSIGRFINPFDYDDGQNTMYSTYSTGKFLRWRNANTSNTDTASLNVTGGTPSAFKVSTNTKNRLFVATGNGKLHRIENSNTVTSSNVAANSTDISGAAFPNAYINSVNTGSNDSFLVATYTSYGVKHVWYSDNAGTSWSNIDGTLGSGGLPDMPIRGAVFDPQSNTKIILATEAGVYSTDLVNGDNTVWTADANFPTVRTDALSIRYSDNTLMAATHGRGVFTAQLPSLPEIRFTSAFVNATESTTGTLNNRNYKDYIIDVAIVAAPSGDATATYGIQASGSAIQGLDYEISANGNFATPTLQHVFANGSVDSKPLTVRIYDDPEQEISETFTITLAVSGATNAYAGASKTYAFTIDDNDFPPIAFGSGMFSADTVSATTSTTITPFRSDLLKHRIQVLYTAAQLKNAGIISAGKISSLKLKVITKNSTRPFSGFTISMANSATSNLNSNYASGTFNTVWSGNYSTVLGDNNFAFITPFDWDGVSNVVIQYCFDNGAEAAAEAASDIVEVYTASASIRHSIYSNQTTVTTTAGCSLGAAFISYQRPTTTFGASYGTLIASTLNSSKTEYFVTGAAINDFFFYTSIGEILATFKNTSMFTYGFTQVSIDRAGTGVTKFYSETDTSKFLMDKTYRVTPTNNSSSGRYEVTFYFTKAEKEEWEAKTKQSFTNIQVIKVPGQISSVTPSNPSGAGAVEVINPISVGSLGDNFFITANVTTGFSGFGFGLPFGILPANLTFNGKVQGNDALLEWVTTSEQNTKTFEVEKSVDGVTYRTIGTVRAAGNSNAKRNYSFIDKSFNADVNYYRLNVVDNDNRAAKTNTVVLRSKAKQALIVVNNPFRTYIDIRFVKAPQGRVKLQLADLSGRVMHTQASNSLTQNVLRFDLSSKTLGRGIYILTAEVDGMKYSSRVMKQ